MTVKNCVMCGKPAQEGVDFCPDCYKGLEDRCRPVPEEPPPPPKDRRPLLAGLLGVALIALGFRVPGIIRAFSPPKPLHRGAGVTDRTADRCVRNLWTVSRLLQENRWPGLELTCPATGRPYIDEKSGAGTTVRCPTPEAHRVSALRVSRIEPKPEVLP